MKIYVYKITNKINNMMYVGKTVQMPSKRFAAHMADAKSGRYQNYFHNSIRSYGKDQFEISILEEITDDEALAYEREKYWIEHLNTLSPAGYNSNGGGKGGSYNPSEETRRKMSAAKIGVVAWNKGRGVQKRAKDNKRRARNRDIQAKIDFYSNL